LPFAIYSDFVSLPEFVTWPTSVYVPGKAGQWSSLSPLVGKAHRAKARRLAASIQQGTVTASLILPKLGSYRRQNSLALALREIGRIERSMLTLARIENPSLRSRLTAGLNKGEAKNSLAKVVFFNRLGEVRDRSSSEEHCCGSTLGQLKK
jgi:TnpA family transposase